MYLDHNATTPLDPRVLEKMRPYFTEQYGNPSSQDHIFGANALDAVEHAREQLAATIRAKPEEIIFTSGATEANNIAVLGLASARRDKGKHIVTAATEHKAVLGPCYYLRDRGYDVTNLTVDKFGMVHPEQLMKAIRKDTILVSIMAANNEIGTVNPLKELAQVCDDKGVCFHTDAAQSFGHVQLDLSVLKVGMLSMSGHKIYGPKGTGALFVRGREIASGVNPLVLGGGQERGLRSGTLNVPGIVGLGEAARLSKKEMDSQQNRSLTFAGHFLERIGRNLGGVHLNGHPRERLSHNLSLTLDGISNKALIQAVRGEVAISSSSACTAASVEPSHVLTAIGLTREQAFQTIRVGFGRFTTDVEAGFAADAIIEAGRRIRRLNG